MEKCAKDVLRQWGKRLICLADALLFGALFASSVLLLFRQAAHRKAAWLLLTSATALLLLLAEHRSAAMRERKERERIVRTIQTEKLLLMRERELAKALGADRIAWIRSKEPETQEILRAITRRPEVLVCMGNAGEAAELLAAYAPQTRLIEAEELRRVIRPAVSEREIESRRKKTRRRRSARELFDRLRHVPVNRYLLLGTLLLVLSYVGRYKIYYRVLSAACLFFALIKGLFAHEKVLKKFRFFLDNMDR